MQNVCYNIGCYVTVSNTSKRNVSQTLVVSSDYQGGKANVSSTGTDKSDWQLDGLREMFTYLKIIIVN